MTTKWEHERYLKNATIITPLAWAARNKMHRHDAAAGTDVFSHSFPAVRTVLFTHDRQYVGRHAHNLRRLHCYPLRCFTSREVKALAVHARLWPIRFLRGSLWTWIVTALHRSYDRAGIHEVSNDVMPLSDCAEQRDQILDWMQSIRMADLWHTSICEFMRLTFNDRRDKIYRLYWMKKLLFK